MLVNNFFGLLNIINFIKNLDIYCKKDSELLFKLYRQHSNNFTCILIISNLSLNDWWICFSLLYSELTAFQISQWIILQLSDCWIDILYSHKENSFNIHQLFHYSQSNLNRFNFRIYNIYISNLKQVCHIIFIARNHNKNQARLSILLIDYTQKYCKDNSLATILSELNSTMLLKHILKFWLNLWNFVAYFKELLAKLYHQSHNFHIISWLSACFNWLHLSKQLLLQLLFIQHSTVRLLQSFITWTILILNLWLQYLSQNLKDSLWYVKISHCLSALFKCSDYTLQATFHLGWDNMLSLWCSTSK